MDARSLIQNYLLGDITEAELKQLDELLASDPALRRDYVLAAAVDSGLRKVAFEQEVESTQDLQTPLPTAKSKLILPLMLASLAAAILLMFGAFRWLQGPSAVATLVSSENAAWESSLPTTPGSKLSAGSMKLVSGIATVRFNSGAEVMIEAPANLALISSMRGKLVDGAAVVSVPEPAIGFVLETPSGYVVDHGTQFAVNVAGKGKPSGFEVIEGEISVHLNSTGEQVRLTEQQSASISQEKLTAFEGQLPEEELEQTSPVFRVGTAGRSGTVIRHNKRKKRITPEVLLVKQGGANGKWDLRSFFSFDVSNVNLESSMSVRLRLNMVPSGFGFATRLPKINRFAVYGLTNSAKDNWVVESLWEESPGPEDGVLLGTFEVPRSQQRGGVGIDDSRLLEFLKANQSRPITLILVRETGQIHGEGPGLVHAFASDSHPEASGPALEFLPKRNLRP